MQSPAPVPRGASQHSAWISRVFWISLLENPLSEAEAEQYENVEFGSSCRYSAGSTAGLCRHWRLQKCFLDLDASPRLLLSP